ncbi:MAG: hypothetical protein IKR57_03325 [Bacilli bacterium]|nr:hypothetical protein [Bacilli bacterium]
MLEEKINSMKEKRLKVDSYDVKDVMSDIVSNIKNNIDTLKKTFNQEYEEELDVNMLFNSFDLVDFYTEIYKNDFGLVTNSFSPYGLIGLIVDNEISIYNLANILSLIIQSRNSIILELKKSKKSLILLISMINKVLNEKRIVPIETNKYLSNMNTYDLLIFIGDKDKFNRLNNTCEKKYYGIGNYELIIDTELDKKLIETAKKKNVLITYKTKDDRFYTNFSRISSNYCVSLMTDSKEEARVFFRDMKASFLLVNIIPTLEKRINIRFEDLIYQKSCIVYEE